MKKSEVNVTDISALGEFGLIRHLTDHIKIGNKHTVTGIGDDAAVFNADGKRVLMTTDLLIEGVHFDMVYTPLKHLGYKSVAVNLSDLAAMNAAPAHITVSLAISSRFSVEALEELYAGIRHACDYYKVDLVGGDTSGSLSGLLISVTAVGYADAEDIVLRSTAKEHDLICVSGDLGSSYAGLLLLEREKATYQANPDMQPELDGYDYPLQRQLRPEARFDILQKLREKKILPTSMIDVSDGLASEVLHICKESGVGAVIYPEKIPVDPLTAIIGEEFDMDPLTMALNGGEDYELLFTISQQDYETLNDIHDITVIGHITESNSGVNLLTGDNILTPLTAQGWDAFKK